MAADDEPLFAVLERCEYHRQGVACPHGDDCVLRHGDDDDAGESDGEHVRRVAALA